MDLGQRDAHRTADGRSRSLRDMTIDPLCLKQNGEELGPASGGFLEEDRIKQGEVDLGRGLTHLAKDNIGSIVGILRASLPTS